MKNFSRIITLSAISAMPMSAQAQSGDGTEILFSILCPQVNHSAEEIMKGRQAGVTQNALHNELRRQIGGKGIAWQVTEAVIARAYQKTIQDSDKKKQLAIVIFANEMELACYNGELVSL